MERMSKERIELGFRIRIEEPSLQEVTLVVTKLAGFLKDHGVENPKFLSDFELAAAEAINNAVEHGCAGSAEPYFEVRLRMLPECVELAVEDPSQFTGWQKEPQLPEDPLSEGGRGYFLLSQTTDELRHELVNGRHVLFIKKNFSYRGTWNYQPGKAEQTLQEMTEELLASYEMINTLIALGEWLATAPNMTSFIHGALSRLCETTRADVAYVRFHQAGVLNLLYAWGETYDLPPEEIPLKSQFVETEVFNSGNEITLPRCSDLEEDDPLHQLLDSAFITPVTFKDVPHGILVLGRVKPQAYFDAGQLKIARTVAEYLGIITTLTELQEQRAIEERAARDLEIAAQIQSSMLPNDFSGIEGLDVFGLCAPALQAGGDYFDFIRLPNGGLLCLIADVMGKGLPAAQLAIMLRMTLRTLLADREVSVDLLLTRANQILAEDLMRLEMFITAACVYIPPDRQQIQFASAGHTPAILQHAVQNFITFESTGIPIGVFDDSHYTCQSIDFHEGDRLLLFTDGIAEASDPDGLMFEEGGIQKCLLETHSAPSRETLEVLLQRVDEFTRHSPPSDDRTAILITRKKTSLSLP